MNYVREEAQQRLSALKKQLSVRQLAEARGQVERLQIDAILADAKRWLGLDSSPL